MEQNNILNEFSDPVYEPATVGQRLANYLIDVVIFYVVVIVIFVPLVIGLASSGSSAEAGGFIAVTYLITFAIFFGYYIFMEGGKGKTIGKMATKTKVITTDGSSMTYGKAALRTLIRMVPLEFISAFLGTSMWHDKWSNTMVVKDK